ncbi:hit finger domain protein [Colletotrichum chrysophilum]|uniref:Hit finger domain protein n=1 Tax=Colletotrichum chrysophilum TaxID=1836956 RepID=A0AAD9EK51_9PEZI|nr:hit finger domain protein [Colletotrichum chrysophilum]
MSADNDGPPPQPVVPRSPKRSQDVLEELIEHANKRSRTVSPHENQQEAEGAAAKSGEKDAPAANGTTSKDATGEAVDESRKQEVSQNLAKEPAPTTAPQTQEPEAVPEPKAAPKTKMCGICNEKEGKYKCTRCPLPFCSVQCSKIHRENHPPDPEPVPKPPVEAPKQPGAKKAFDPKNPFSVLDDSPQLRYLFKRYPSLKSRLLVILAATEPPPELQGTGNSLNNTMKARALAAANPKKEQWSHDVGIRNGKEALRKARTAAGEDGEGVREYIELINHLILKGEDAAAEEAIRKSAAEKDTDLIRKLLEEGR